MEESSESSIDRPALSARRPPSRARAFAVSVWARGARLRTRARALLKRYLPSESQHLFALTLVVGVACGLAAVAFHLGIRATEALLIQRALHATGSTWIAWTIVTPALGGLVAGALLTWVVPGARGSGIPQVKQAFALEGGRVRFRDAFGKFWIGVLQIGSGASLGREGPTVQICAGVASLLGRATALPAKNMRRLLPVGVAAGIAAAFNAPIAAVTFTIEEIVGTLDHAVLSGVVIAAAVAAVIERGVLGVHPVIEVEQSYGLDHASSLFFYALLGLVAAGVSVAFTDGLLKLRKWFRTFTALPRWTHPAVGGLVTGVLAVAMVALLHTEGVTGGGYETLSKALAGKLGLEVLLALCAVKVVATVFSYSSGGAGGIFAPALFVGAMLGGAMGYVDVAALGHEERQLGAFALVGMGAVFAGVIRAPITSVLIIFEMTGGYGLVLPLMLANMSSYLLAKRLRPTPIYEALLEQDGVVLPHAETRTHALEALTAGDAMTAEVVSARGSDAVQDVRRRVGERTFEMLPITTAEGGVTGLLPMARLRSASGEELLRPVSTLQLPVCTVRADAPLTRAVVRMNEAGVRQLAVMDAHTGTRLVGVLSISDLVRAHARAVPHAVSEPAHDGSPEGAGPELRAAKLARPAPVVSGATTIDDLLARLAASPGRAVIVRSPGSKDGVVVPDDLTEILADRALLSMLVAADVVRPVSEVEPHATLDELARLAGAGAAAILVRATGEVEPRGVITRAAIATALFEQYSRAPVD